MVVRDAKTHAAHGDAPDGPMTGAEYAATVDWLFGLQMFGIKLGLDNIRELLAALGDPHERLAAVHVAGTNGKGSTSAFIAAALGEAGLRVGLYTSPHLVDFSERIRIDGVPLAQNRIVAWAARLRPDAERLRATFFEVTTAMAFAAFADAEVDAAVIETGMGGRLDATNIVMPRASVITGIDLEHTEFLGDTLEAIAGEKAGIIKRGVPVFTAAVQPVVVDLLRRRAEDLGAPFLHVEPETGEVVLRDVDDMRAVLRLGGRVRELRIGFAGAHQVRNAQLAAAVLEHVAPQLGVRDVDGAVTAGLARAHVRTGLRARLERIGTDPELVVDVAHNPAGVAALVETWCAMRESARTHLVFGMLRTKDVRAVVELLRARAWASVTAVACAGHETWSAAEIAGMWGDEVLQGESVAEGVRAACDRALGRRDAVPPLAAGRRPSTGVLVFGSHYVVGEYLAGC